MSHESTHPNGCILCPVFHPDYDPRLPDRPRVCEGCRFRFSRNLAEIGRYHHLLLNPDRVEYDDRWYEANFELWDPAAKTWTQHAEQRRTDPLGALQGVGPIPSRNRRPSVSGSRERPVPVRLDVVDLTGPAHRFNPTRDPSTYLPNQQPDDATGHLSAATVLADLAQDWRDTLWPDHHLPEATVPALVEWLRAGADLDNPGTRIDEACDRHPAIADTAEEIRLLRSALRSAAGETEPQPELVDGVACRSCDARALFRKPGDVYRAECGMCGLLYTENEFARWTSLLAASAKDEYAEIR